MFGTIAITVILLLAAFLNLCSDATGRDARAAIAHINAALEKIFALINDFQSWRAGRRTRPKILQWRENSAAGLLAAARYTSGAATRKSALAVWKSQKARRHRAS